MPCMAQTDDPISDEALIEAARAGAAEPAPLPAPGWDRVAGRVRVGLWRAGELLGRGEAVDADPARNPSRARTAPSIKTSSEPPGSPIVMVPSGDAARR